MYNVSVVFDDAARSSNLMLRPGHNLVTGENHFQGRFPNSTSLEEDLLTVCSAIFAADLAVKRGQREAFTRSFNVTIPVVNLASFNGIRDDLRYALYLLSNDAWRLTFEQRGGTPETPSKWDSGKEGKVLLFSGGLDSLAAAIRFGDAGENVQLVSHVTANRVVSDAQTALFEYLRTEYPRQFDRLAVRVGGRNQGGYEFPRDQEREETQRTRSLVFLSLAALVARRRGFHKIVIIAENGQMAIHLPLTAARISAFSTHTAHPEYIAVIGQLFSRLLGFDIQIENPFLYSTKGEVVRDCVLSHLPVVKRSVSCWKASRVAGAKNHCGFCIPCLLRRIAIESYGMKLDEYQRDLLVEDAGSLDINDDGKRNLMELAEFVCHFEKKYNRAHYFSLFPELVNAPIDSAAAIAMYERFAAEARQVFDKYPNLATVLK